MSKLLSLATLATCVVLSTGCSSDDDESSNTGTDSKATIELTSPAEGATVTTEAEVSGTDVELPVEIEFTLTNFTLKEPGTCGGDKACGQVFVKVDGDACNDTEATGEKEPYNELQFASPADADLLYCPGVVLGPPIAGADGPHEITVELHTDDGAAVMAGGKVVSDKVSITVQVSAGGAAGAAGAAGAGGTAGAAGGG